MATFNEAINKWYNQTPISITNQNATFTVQAGGKYVGKNIELSINIPGMIISKPTSGTNTFYITVPNGSSGTVTFTFTVDANGNTTIT